MVRIKRLIRPDSQALNWKAAVPVLGLAAACMMAFANAAPAADPKGMSNPVVDFKSCQKPMYPHDDLAAGHEGTVTLTFLVGADGKTKEAKTIKSSGYPAMDEAARSAILKCDFKPAMKDGKPVEAWAPIQYVWKAH